MTVEAEVIHDIPDDLAAMIGKVMVAYAFVEHKLTSLAGLILQLNKAEMRLALRTPRASDRLEIALDLLALKAIVPSVDTVRLKTIIEQATTLRDQLAHGLWLRHPETGQIYLRIARGQWPKSLTQGERINRSIFPQSVPYGVKDCQAALDLCLQAIAGIDALGLDLDHALHTLPERFREQSPLLNPLGHRAPKEPKPQRGPSPQK